MKPTFAVHSYPWYISDWTESETRIELTLAERGLYRELIDRCYKEGSIPDDERKLIALCACDPRDFKRAWPNVRRKFKPTEDGRLEHQRVTDVLLKLENWNEARRKGGYSRQRSSSGKAPVKADDKLTTSFGTSSSPSTTSSSSTTTTPPPNDTPSLNANGMVTDPGGDLCAIFEREFKGEWLPDTWRVFPSHVTASNARAFEANMPLWMKTRKYIDGFGQNSVKFLASQVWLKPPPNNMLAPQWRESDNGGGTVYRDHVPLAMQPRKPGEELPTPEETAEFERTLREKMRAKERG